MENKKFYFLAVLATAILVFAPSSFAVGAPTGPKTKWPKQGKLGSVIMNPYKLAPLTAIIMDDGYKLSKVKVSIMPKKGGQVLSYSVKDMKTRLYGGIPIFGLYADYKNTVKVSYTKTDAGGKATDVKESYTIYTGPVYLDPIGDLRQKYIPFGEAKVLKASKKYADRFYLINNIPGAINGRTAQMLWNNPEGGSLQNNDSTNAFIVDAKGEVRWYLNSDRLLNYHDIYKTGGMMGFQQGKDGTITFAYGQRYVKYDIMGREIFSRILPSAYIDFSHSMDAAQNGHYFLRVGSANTKRADGKNLRTIRDVILEVDDSGNVVDDFRLFEILDPYRSTIVKVLDRGAVCVNVDDTLKGQTLSKEEVEKLEKSDKFGDMLGTGIGRNWAHVNSVDYDPSDDSIIISARHQSAIIKIGRDKKVKWILGAHKGWKGKYKDVLLQPIDKQGKKIICEDEYSKCPGFLEKGNGFDWTWAQHTAFRIDSKSDKRYIYVSAFDNGDSRGVRQPAFANMKYSRAVIYKIDQQNHTVEQVWSFGKQLGNKWYSPITSLTQYEEDKNSVMIYSATAGMGFGPPEPEILEIDYGSSKPSLHIKFTGTGMGYQAMPFRPALLF